MKNFFIKIRDWFKAHGPSKRRLIQVYAALLYNANIKGFVTGNIYKGNSKNMCVPGLNCYSCPGAVGACPLGSLQNSLAASDMKVSFYIIGILALFGLIFARTICGFLCPVGLGQELLYKVKTPKVKKSKATKVLSYLKYVILFVLVILLSIFFGEGYPMFCKYICPAGTVAGIGLLANPNNAGLYSSLGTLFTWKFAVLVVIIVLCIFFYRFFCRFLCPLGAIYGFFNKFAFFGVSVDKEKCTDCGLCVSHCKMDINHVGDHECIECGECMKVCPTQAISWKGSQLFLHGSAIAETAVAEETPDISNLLAKGSAVAVQPMEVAAVNVNAVEDKVEVTKAESPTKAVNTANKPVESPAMAKIKRRNMWLEIAAWTLATIVLITALVYYNFIAKDVGSSLYQVGDTVEDFTLRTYDDTAEGGTFSLSETEGKVVILNFWATWCSGCVEELPEFNELQNNYPDDIKVVAIHDVFITVPDVQAYIDAEGKNKESWSDYSITFAQDEESFTVADSEQKISLVNRFPGASNGLPLTVVIDRSGKITTIWGGELNYSKLEGFIKDLI